MEKILNYIGGRLVEPKGEPRSVEPKGEAKYLSNFNPSIGAVYSLVPDSGSLDVVAAVEAAEAAFPGWSKTPAEERAKILRKLAKGIENSFEDLARAESIDNGKPISVSRSVDIPRSQKNLDFFADLVVEFKGENFLNEGRGLNRSSYSPLGVVAIISPWNLPLYSLTWKIAPALAAGNTVVAKPSEITPMTAFLFSKICIAAGLPPGVLNILHGRGAQVGTPLVTSAKVKAVSFTGSTLTGRNISQVTAGQFKKISLEMGGKNANIIFADCDFEKAVDTTIRSSFANQGQICLCGSRIFVERKIYEKFRDALVLKAKALRVGDPLDEKTEQGALVSKEHLEKVLSFIDLAKAEGCKILCGGSRPTTPGPQANGYFLSPTLIEGSSHKSRLNQEEIFGPVATLIPFETEDEVISLANGTRYGLSASVWTQDVSRANRVASALEVGVVWINSWMLRDLRTPFGGVKDSGMGREGGFYALQFFSEVKTICDGTEEL